MRKKNAGSRSEETANLAIQICRDQPGRGYESALREAEVRLRRGELSPIRHQKVAGRRLERQQTRSGNSSQSTAARAVEMSLNSGVPYEQALKRAESEFARSPGGRMKYSRRLSRGSSSAGRNPQQILTCREDLNAALAVTKQYGGGSDVYDQVIFAVTSR